MRLILISVISCLLLFLAQNAHAAFVVRITGSDTMVATNVAAHASPTGGDGWSPFSKPKSRLSRVAYGLALGSLIGVAALSVAAYITAFIAVLPAIFNALFIVLICAGIAGFILGIIALSRGEPEKHFAKRAVIIGGIWIFAMLSGYVMPLFYARR